MCSDTELLFFVGALYQMEQNAGYQWPYGAVVLPMNISHEQHEYCSLWLLNPRAGWTADHSGPVEVFFVPKLLVDNNHCSVAIFSINEDGLPNIQLVNVDVRCHEQSILLSSALDNPLTETEPAASHRV